MKFIVIPADMEEPMRLEEFEGSGIEKARELIGGYVALAPVQGHKNLQMCVDEDGLLMGKPFNFRASLVAALSGQSIVGDAVVCGRNFKDVEAVAPDVANIIAAWQRP